MKIVCIFAEELYTVHYSDQDKNEFDRLMDLWTDVSYLWKYAKTHTISNPNSWVENRLLDAEDFENRLDETTLKTKPLNAFFVPYHNQEYDRGMVLSQQKGKLRYNHLRLYAVKVHDNCFLITSGAIKMSNSTQGNDENNAAIEKLIFARDYLKREGIIDDDSFYELLNELE